MASLVVTPAMREVLEEATACSGASQEVHEEAGSAATAPTVRWSVLKASVEALRVAAPPDSKHTRLRLHALCWGSGLALEAPPPRVRSKELDARNAKLQIKLDNDRYDAMVADVTVSERFAKSMEEPLLPTTRLQMGFGIQVLVTMGTFYALAYVCTKYYLEWDELWSGLTGAVGLTAGLLLETTLLIVRTTMPPPLHKQYPHLFPELATLPQRSVRDGGSASEAVVRPEGEEQVGWLDAKKAR